MDEDNKNFAEIKKSAEQGNAYALNKLGDMYQHGQGIEQDYVKAVNYYRKAADKRHPAALNNLEYMFDHSLGDPDSVYHAFIVLDKSKMHKRFNLLAIHQPSDFDALMEKNPQDNWTIINQRLYKETADIVHQRQQRKLIQELIITQHEIDNAIANRVSIGLDPALIVSIYATSNNKSHLIFGIEKLVTTEITSKKILTEIEKLINHAEGEWNTIASNNFFSAIPASIQYISAAIKEANENNRYTETFCTVKQRLFDARVNSASQSNSIKKLHDNLWHEIEESAIQEEHKNTL